MELMEAFSSCDTFVILPPLTKNGVIIFGKNSDRPEDEVQEFVFLQAKDHSADSVQCTYITIPQVPHTYAVALSKPAWMWGAEMGANEHGICIGNEAVFTKAQGPQDKEEKLLGMDLVRLALERSKTAAEAVNITVKLLEMFGQGGRCFESEEMLHVTYHNSFIIVDPEEAYLLETVGKHWAVERITNGYRNISNQLSIGTKIDMKSQGLEEYAKSNGWWNGHGVLDFAQVFKANGPSSSCAKYSAEGRYRAGQELLKKFSSENTFDTECMFKILRDTESGICRTGLNRLQFASATVGSQVSILPPCAGNRTAVHWFTVTPNPAASVFKPFAFVGGVVSTPLTVSPQFGDADPVRQVPRFTYKVDRRHELYKAHGNIKPLPGNSVNQKVRELLQEIEKQCVSDVSKYFQSHTPEQLEDLQDIFKDSVETEIRVYNTN